MPSAPASTARSPYLVHTHAGDGTVSTERFPTAQDRLAALRRLAQDRFPGREVPRTPSDTDEASYLAQLLGFFLMFNDGRVTLEDIALPEE